MKAVLIAGDGRFFLDQMRMFKRFLVHEVGIEKVQIIQTAYLKWQQFDTLFAAALDPKNVDGPLLLAWCGHGAERGWSLSFMEDYLYMFVAQFIKNYPAPVLFINDCCSAYSIVAEFEKRKVSKRHVSLIAASDKTEEVEPGLTRRIIRSWRQQMVHEPCMISVLDFDRSRTNSLVTSDVPTSEKRWGVTLDTLFFTQRPDISKKRAVFKRLKPVVLIP